MLATGCRNTPDANSSKPLWQNLAELLGKSIESQELKEFVTAYNLKEYTKGPCGGFGNSSLPFSLLYREYKIDNIVITVSVDPEYPAPVFTNQLPYRLDSKDSPEDVISKLGKPSHRPYRECISYDALGLNVSFWSKTDKMSEICLSLMEKE